MPNHRQLQTSAQASWGVPRLPSAASLAVVGLTIAVLVAIVGTVLPIAQPLSAVVAALIAVPCAVIGLRRTRSMPGGTQDLGAVARDAAFTDALTGAGNAAGLAAALSAAVLDPDASPLAVVRLVVASSRRPAPSPADPMPPEPLPLDDHRLVLTAVRWQETLRPDDHLIRLTGNEFAVVLTQCDARASEAVVARLTAAVPEGAICATSVANWDGLEPPDSLLERAERSLDAGRARLVADPLLDSARVAAVAATGLAVRQTRVEFDEMATGVARLLATPIVTISLFDEQWQHYLGAHGVDEHGGSLEGTNAEDAICRQTISSGHPLVVSDTRRHPVLQHTPASQSLGVLACASVPITDDAGHVLGSVCAMVLERHAWTGDEVGLLKLTASRVGERLAMVPGDGVGAA